jgi:hypothetical protein
LVLFHLLGFVIVYFEPPPPSSFHTYTRSLKMVL